MQYGTSDDNSLPLAKVSGLVPVATPAMSATPSVRQGPPAATPGTQQHEWQMEIPQVVILQATLPGLNEQPAEQLETYNTKKDQN